MSGICLFTSFVPGQPWMTARTHGTRDYSWVMAADYHTFRSTLQFEKEFVFDQFSNRLATLRQEQKWDEYARSLGVFWKRVWSIGGSERALIRASNRFFFFSRFVDLKTQAFYSPHKRLSFTRLCLLEVGQWDINASCKQFN
jgi:hypothetical protein